jgi:hypothetical protein
MSPNSAVIFGPNGDLYGTTPYSCCNNASDGEVYQVTP